MTLIEKRDELLRDLLDIPDPMTRLEELMDRARTRPPAPDSIRVESNEVHGCQSQLWLAAELRDGRCWYAAESDALIVKAIAGLLADFYTGATPAEVMSLDPSFLKDAGITEHLSSNRRNGLGKLWERIRGFAQRNV